MASWNVDRGWSPFCEVEGKVNLGRVMDKQVGCLYCYVVVTKPRYRQLQDVATRVSVAGHIT